MVFDQPLRPQKCSSWRQNLQPKRHGQLRLLGSQGRQPLGILEGEARPLGAVERRSLGGAGNLERVAQPLL